MIDATLFAPTRSQLKLAAAAPAGAALPGLSKLAAALGGETAFYISPGEPIPTFTLVTQPADPQAAADALDKAFAGLGSGAGASPGAASCAARQCYGSRRRGKRRCRRMVRPLTPRGGWRP